MFCTFLLLFAPFVLLANLLFFSRGKIILDVECLTNFLRSFAFDHVGNSLASNIQQALNVQIIGSQNELKKGSLINFEEIRVPRTDIVGSLLLVFVILRWWRVIFVVGGPLNDL